MSAQDLSFAELVTATKPFVSGDFATWFRGEDIGKPFAAEIDDVRPLIVGAMTGSSEVDRLTEALAETDGEHDEALRFGDGLLTSYAEHYHVADVRDTARKMQALILPDGVSLVNKSYEEEAGRAQARDDVRTDDVRTQLARFRLVETDGGPANFDEWLDQVLQPSSKKLGELLDQRKRAALVDAGPTGEALLDAKRKLIALVRQVFATYDAIGGQLDDAARSNLAAARAVWDEEVRKATANAARRRAARARGETPPDPAA